MGLPERIYANTLKIKYKIYICKKMIPLKR